MTKRYFYKVVAFDRHSNPLFNIALQILVSVDDTNRVRLDDRQLGWSFETKTVSKKPARSYYANVAKFCKKLIVIPILEIR